MIKHYQEDTQSCDFLISWQIGQGQDEPIHRVCDWVEGHQGEIDSILTTSGALLIRGFNTLQSAVDFDKVIRLISPKLMNYVGGTSPRKQVYGNIMTATYAPPTWSMPLHQEMSYIKNAPDRIAFFCLRSAEEGGYSTIGNMRQITRSIKPSILERVKAHGLQLRRALPSRDGLSKKPGLPKSWNEVLGTNSREEVNDIAQRMGWNAVWLDEDTLQLWQEILPATKLHPKHQDEVWFNQIHVFAPMGTEAWARRDRRDTDLDQILQARKNNPQLLDTVVLGNGEAIPDEDVMKIARVFEKNEVNLKLMPSDLLILDNILVAHGRTPFVGEREILVALIHH